MTYVLNTLTRWGSPSASSVEETSTLGQPLLERLERRRPKLGHLGARRFLERLEHVPQEHAERHVRHEPVLHEGAEEEGGGA